MLEEEHKLVCVINYLRVRKPVRDKLWQKERQLGCDKFSERKNLCMINYRRENTNKWEENDSLYHKLADRKKINHCKINYLRGKTVISVWYIISEEER